MTDRLARDRRILQRFVGIFCRERHGTPRGELCADCASLLAYAEDRLAHCPLDPKPKCKDCAIHCYAPAQRARIREVMRFAGLHQAKRGRIDWLLRYVLR